MIERGFVSRASARESVVFFVSAGLVVITKPVCCPIT